MRIHSLPRPTLASHAMRWFLVAAMLTIALALAACSSEVDTERIDADLGSLKEDTGSLREGLGELEAQVMPLPQQIDILERRFLAARMSEEDLAQRLEQQRLAQADYESRTNSIINRLQDDIERIDGEIASLEEQLKLHVEDRAKLYYDILVDDFCDVLPEDVRAAACQRDSTGRTWILRQ